MHKHSHLYVPLEFHPLLTAGDRKRGRQAEKPKYFFSQAQTAGLSNNLDKKKKQEISNPQSTFFIRRKRTKPYYGSGALDYHS